MRRFILTGTPGSGKTALIRRLELDGFGVVEESATDVIALSQAQEISEPWKSPRFIDDIFELQRSRQLRAALLPDRIQFHDRSVFCTAALAEYLGYPVPDPLARELDRVTREAIFERQVFFVCNLGRITPTAARRITFEEALQFERIHQDTYRKRGFELVFIDPAPLPERVSTILRRVQALPPAALSM